ILCNGCYRHLNIFIKFRIKYHSQVKAISLPPCLFILSSESLTSMLMTVLTHRVNNDGIHERLCLLTNSIHIGPRSQAIKSMCFQHFSMLLGPYFARSKSSGQSFLLAV